MNDVCVKGRLDGLEIAFAFADTTEVVNELVLIHDCDPVAAHLFGPKHNGSRIRSISFARWTKA